MARSTISMARSTPAQKPLGSAKITCIEWPQSMIILPVLVPKSGESYKFSEILTASVAGDIRYFNR
jgi:hypothetical protein